MGGLSLRRGHSVGTDIQCPHSLTNTVLIPMWSIFFVTHPLVSYGQSQHAPFLFHNWRFDHTLKCYYCFFFDGGGVGVAGPEYPTIQAAPPYSAVTVFSQGPLGPQSASSFALAQKACAASNVMVPA